jgi:hypothetical protein
MHRRDTRNSPKKKLDAVGIEPTTFHMYMVYLCEATDGLLVSCYSLGEQAVEAYKSYPLKSC